MTTVMFAGVEVELNQLGVPDGFITGVGRDYPHPRLAHLYEGPFHDPGNPMCRYGWNRDDGLSYSIWRNNVGIGGICKICVKRARAGLKGVECRPFTPEEIELGYDKEDE